MTMTNLTIATWNINSVRLRWRLIERLLVAAKPDVIALQETKTPDEFFPAQELRDLGYAHQLFSGMKGYNGVAFLSRLPLTRLSGPDWCGRGDCRHLAARLDNGVELHNFYVPAGGDIPDRALNDKFGHKLDFIAEAAQFWRREHKNAAPKILLGDLNIAPLEQDVWSHKQLLDVVSHTPVEVAGLLEWQSAHGFVDAIRYFVPANEKLYSWWSYRNRDWRKSDRGRRLDHIWVTPNLRDNLRSQKILKDARDWPQPSDHVPVTLTLDLP